MFAFLHFWNNEFFLALDLVGVYDCFIKTENEDGEF